ncbi:hypothetical protein ACST13_07245 [Aquirufa sp. A-Brett2-W8]
MTKSRSDDYRNAAKSEGRLNDEVATKSRSDDYRNAATTLR